MVIKRVGEFLHFGEKVIYKHELFLLTTEPQLALGEFRIPQRKETQ